MKTKSLLLILLLFPFVTVLKAQVDVGDSLALVDLYNATGGAEWDRNANWLTDKPVRTWYDVTVKDHRVTKLDLGFNNMRGTLPASIGNLTKLDSFYIQNNYFITGSIPTSIGNMKALRDLRMAANALSGSIPDTIGNLTRLFNLDISQNKLTGSIPASIGKLVQLTNISLYINQLSGSIPEAIGALSELRSITLWQNLLSGPIPESFGNLVNLTYIGLEDNRLTGAIPESFGNLTQVGYLNLSYNQLTRIPSNIGNLELLYDLYISHNNLQDTIPSSIGDLINLTELYLNDNQLTGKVPVSIGNLASLLYLHLERNKLTRNLPATIGDMGNVRLLNVSNNELTGAIPASIGRMKFLTELYLFENKLTGELPVSITRLKSLFRMNVSHNQLTQKDNLDNSNNYINTTLYLNVSDNSYTFNGLEYLSRAVNDIRYFDQASIQIHIYKKKLAVSAGGTLSNNTYSWFKTGSSDSIVIQDDSTFQPTRSGSYYAKITNSVVVGLTLKTDTFTYVMPLAKNELNISISPNPARGMISIYGLNEKSDAKITVADISGYVWMKTVSHQQPAMKVDVSRLKAGNYLVSVSDGKEVKTVMFVKE